MARADSHHEVVAWNLKRRIAMGQARSAVFQGNLWRSGIEEHDIAQL